MEHRHTVYDTDTHFIIDPITRAITNAESKKTLLMQNDHNSEEFTFEIDKVVEGHDMTLCNQVEIHYSNVDSTKRNSSLGVYEVNDLTANEDGSKITFTWIVSENATFYAGSLSFLIKFMCVENGVITYRWNTAVNNSITIAKGMQNGEAITEAYPDILNQWKEELFAAVYGYKTIQVGPVEPDIYPYIWFDTSYSDNQNVGMITVKNMDGIVRVISPMVSINAIAGLVEMFDSKANVNHQHSMNNVLGLSEALNNKSNVSHTHTPASIGAEQARLERTVTLQASAWRSNAQKVPASGVRVDNLVVVSAAPASHVAYGEAGVYCSAQSLGSLTFSCSDVPTENLSVNVVIWR